MTRATKKSIVVLASAALLLGLSACSAPAEPEPTTPAPEESTAETVTADLVDPAGDRVGTVEVREVDGGLEFAVDVDGLSPGFHAMHIHSIGVCEPDSPDPLNPANTGDFLSAGGHIGAGTSDHGSHAGDLPSLLVHDDGAGTLTAETAALTMAELLDEDGSAVMIHADEDNFANVPERYASDGPDETTLATGDAGGRVACAAFTK